MIQLILQVCQTGADPVGGYRSPKTWESTSFHSEFAKFGKHHLRQKDILASIVLP